MIDRRIVVLSYMSRSGSTYAAMLLHEHPDVVVTPEARFPRAMLGHGEAARKDIDTPAALSDYIESLRRDYKFASWGLAHEPLLAHLQQHVGLPAKPPQLLAGILDFHAATQKPASRVVIFKKGRCLDDFDAIVRAVPNAYVLHMQRDPRAVYASQLAATNSRHGLAMAAPPTVFAKRWASDARAVSELRGREELHVLSYEELVLDPHTVLEEVQEWLGCAPASVSANGGAYAAVIPQQQAHLHQRLQTAPDPARIEKWRDSLSATTQKLLVAVAGPEMRTLGYSAAPAPLALPLGAYVIRDKFLILCRAAVMRLKTTLRGERPAAKMAAVVSASGKAS